MTGIIDESLTANITPEEYEAGVEQIIREWGVGLAEFRVERREMLPGTDGEYEIDVSARFDALEVSFLVLIECKHHKRPIKREVVQVLHDKLRAVGGHKGIIFATASFQSGAIEYAQRNGVALIHFADARTTIIAKRDGAKPELSVGMSPYVGWLVQWEGMHEAYVPLSDERRGLVIDLYKR
jgi:restriction system protein